MTQEPRLLTRLVGRRKIRVVALIAVVVGATVAGVLSLGRVRPVAMENVDRYGDDGLIVVGGDCHADLRVTETHQQGPVLHVEIQAAPANSSDDCRGSVLVEATPEVDAVIDLTSGRRFDLPPTAPTTTSTSLPGSTTTTTIPSCAGGVDPERAEAALFSLVDAYNRHDAEAVHGLLGDGPVADIGLTAAGPSDHATVAAWTVAAAAAHDRLDVWGFSAQPLQLIARRSNDLLAAAGIEHLAVVLHLETAADCTPRVRVTDPVSHPDPCGYFGAFDVAPPPNCAAAFEPRESHVAVWTGDELIIQGGASGTVEVPGLRTGLAYDPGADTWRELEPAPAALTDWPGGRVAWTGTQLLFVAVETGAEGLGRTAVFAYDPDTDGWTESAPLPDEPALTGPAVWTGDELIIAGGSTNMPDDRVWAYRPSADTWRELPGSGIAAVEGMAGVWTGREAVFIGGYHGFGATEGVAYDPATEVWRDLAPPPDSQSIEGHELVWTGREIIVVGGHAGPAHRTALAVYDPGADQWRKTSPAPIAVGDGGAADWTGEELIIWGGFGTYGPPDADGDHVYGEGAAYDPALDRWRRLAPSPLSDRCHHSGTWAGREFVVFGGLEVCGDPGILAVGDAAAYDPVTDTWRELR